MKSWWPAQGRRRMKKDITYHPTSCNGGTSVVNGRCLLKWPRMDLGQTGSFRLCESDSVCVHCGLFYLHLVLLNPHCLLSTVSVNCQLRGLFLFLCFFIFYLSRTYPRIRWYNYFIEVYENLRLSRHAWARPRLNIPVDASELVFFFVCLGDLLLPRRILCRSYIPGIFYLTFGTIFNFAWIITVPPALLSS